MAKVTVELTDIIVDCHDPENVATFWGSLLQCPIEGRKGPYVWLARSGGVGLGFQRVTETKQGKNRIHIDVSGPDIALIKDRVEALGGQRVAGYDEGGFLVMADPEGNEFCVVPSHLEFDETGRTGYLAEFNL
jgi:predicted enzyme related to lactoylglutathione lyase